MKLFKLPDLGEGLPDAVIRQWHVAEGESIAADENLVTVETAKALVDVPSPWAGTVEKRFAAEGDTVQVGEPLVGFVEAEAAEDKTSDSGTVVGKIDQSGQVLTGEQAPVSAPRRPATPSVRALARRLGVDLLQLHPKGERLTAEEVRAAAARQLKAENGEQASSAAEPPARRAMALAMSRARDEIMPITLCDQVDVSAWWGSAPPTLRLIRAIQRACLAEPNINALYQGGLLSPSETVNIGLAVDSPRGLFVPVLKDVASRTDDELLQQIEAFKAQARDQGIAQRDLQGATLLFSNFGSMAGRYATPVVLPPMVAIVGAGRVFEGVVAKGGKPVVHPLLPLSISADHRAVTGGELARFLRVLIRALAAGTADSLFD